MALSGSLKSTAYSSGRCVELSWTAEQDVSKNQSTIKWTLKGASNAAHDWYRAGPFQVTIDGKTTTIAATNPRLQLFNGTLVGTGSVIVDHDDKGKKELTISIKAAIYSSSYNCSGSKTFTLNDIPRIATITSAVNFTDEGTPAASYSNPVGTAAKVEIGVFWDSNTSLIPYETVTGTSGTKEFTLTTAQKTTIYNRLANSKSATIYYYIKTTIGTKVTTSYVEKTLTIVNAAPTFTATIKDVGAASTQLTGNGATTIIKGFNYISAAIAATAKKGATIKSYEITNGENIVKSSSAVFENTENSKFTCTIVDSRGNSATKEITLQMVDYIPLTCNVEANIRISTAESTTAEIEYNITGNIYNGSFGAKNNTLRVEVTFEADGGGVASRVLDVPSSAFNGNTYNVTYTETDLDYRETWVVNAIAKDAIKSVSGFSKRLKAIPLFDYGKDDFKFNVPVTFGGGADFPQKVLHTDSGRFLHASQSVKLSGDSTISKQTIGYIFVWFYISNGTIYHENINFSFVPKFAADIGKFTMPLAMDNGTSGAKTVLIAESDDTTTITGYAANGNAPNNQWVLKGIMGI